MPYTVIATSTKPDTSKWFAQVNSSAAKTYNNWLQQLPEIKTFNVNKINENTIVKTYVFENESDWLRMSSQHDNHPVTALRKAHNSAFNIVTTLQIA